MEKMKTEGQTRRAIGEQVGLTKDQVRQYFYRERRKLRRCSVCREMGRRCKCHKKAIASNEAVV